MSKKWIALALAAAMLVLGGCSYFKLDLDLPEGDTEVVTPTPTPQVISGSDGQMLAETYKADHVFSLNTVEGESFNPYTTTSQANLMVSMLVYETLLNAGSDFEAKPNLITSWDTQDGMNWTFYVDTSRTFHDGGTMKSIDAVSTLDQARYSDRYARRFANVVSEGVLSEDSFSVQLRSPNWRFYQLLTIPCVESGTGYNAVPSGTGPYKFNSRLTALKLDPNYPGAEDMPLKTIHLKRYVAAEDILQAFEDSLLDIVANNPADMSSLGYSSSNLVKYVDTTNMHYLGYNANSRIFSQGVYRALVTYAIDRDTIVSGAMQGSAVAATLPIHPNSILYPKAIARTLEYSPDKLQEALDAAAAVDMDYNGVIELGGVPAEIVFLVCSDSPAKLSAARQIASVLRDAGFAVTMRELGYDDFILALGEGEYDLYYGEVRICNDWDITPLVSGSLNYGKLNDSTLTNYIQNFLASGADTLADSTNTLYQYIATMAPITTVCFERTQVLYHRGALSTIEPNQDNYFVDIRDWEVDLD